MLFTDDFVGVSGSKEGLQKLITHGYRIKWRLKANVSKNAMMVFFLEIQYKVSGNGANMRYLGYPITRRY